MNYSRQREAILNFLESSKAHPTAEMVYTALRKEMPNLSRGTVYRNLNVLAESGQIRKLSMDRDTEHYDGDLTPHQHFICKSCGRIEDIFIEEPASLSRAASKRCSGRIDYYETFFFGSCGICTNASDAR